MLRITISELDGPNVRLVLEGRLAGPWADELDRVWGETAPQLRSRNLSIDLRDVTYIDAEGKRVLSKILRWADNAEFIHGSLLANEVAEELSRKISNAG